MSNVDQLIARALGIAEDRVTDGLEYQSIREWDSLGHVSLLVAVEEEYGVEIDEDLTLGLRSVAAVREFAVARAAGTAGGATGAKAPGREDLRTVHRGLEGVVFDRTSLTHIDGVEGVLEYRGYNIHDLAEQSSFEEIAYLLIHGDLPDTAGLELFEKRLRAARPLPAPVLDLVRSLAHAHPMEALRTCVSALGVFGQRQAPGTDESCADALETGISLIARIPMIIAAHHAFRSGREPLQPAPDATHAEAFLTVLLGERPSPAAVRLVDKGFVVHADHGSNASAFTARVAIGCRAGMTAAITAAIAAFSGSVHGGAAERVVSLIDQVGSPENAQAHVEALRRRNEPVMGFGHRVYRTEDPRVRHLRATVLELSEELGDTTGLDILDAVASRSGTPRPDSRPAVRPMAAIRKQVREDGTASVQVRRLQEGAATPPLTTFRTGSDFSRPVRVPSSGSPRRFDRADAPSGGTQGLGAPEDGTRGTIRVSGRGGGRPPAKARCACASHRGRSCSPWRHG